MSLYEETWTQLKELLSEEDYESFYKYVEGLKDGSQEKDKWLVLNGDFSDKEKRAKTHQFFKDNVKLYETDTIVEGNSRKI